MVQLGGALPEEGLRPLFWRLAAHVRERQQQVGEVLGAELGQSLVALDQEAVHPRPGRVDEELGQGPEGEREVGSTERSNALLQCKRGYSALEPS